jgi:hypothetical protein
MVPGRPRRRSLIRLAASVVGSLAGSGAAALALPRTADAAPLPTADVARLDEGEVVRVPLDVDLPEGSCFGGVSYAVIHAPLADVMAVLADPGTYRSILPMTLEVRVLAVHGLDTQVFLRQGSGAGSAGYVLLVRRASQWLIRFWLDPSQPHEIADLWGYFRVQPWAGGASLLTYAALVRLDFGLVKMLFTETIRRHALGTPGLVRAYVQGRGAR